MSSPAMPIASPEPSVRFGVALVALYLVWGSTCLAIRIAVETIPPLSLSAVRFLIAGSLLYLATVGRGDVAGDRPGRREWRDAAVNVRARGGESRRGAPDEIVEPA